MGIPLNFGQSTSENTEFSILSGLGPTLADNVSVKVNDVLYYQYQDVSLNEDGAEKTEKGVVKVIITEINDTTSEILYDFYRPDIQNPTWDWELMNADMEEGDDRWLSDDFSYNLFNHSLIFPTNITNMEVENASENTDALIMDVFNVNANNYTSQYSDETGDWHTIEFTLNKNNNHEEPFSLIAYVNKTTGLMTYYEEFDVNQTMTFELIGFELTDFTFEVPDSYGLTPGDTIDRFIPESEDSEDDSKDDFKDGMGDDHFEDNDDYASAQHIDPDRVHGQLALMDEDFYFVYLEDGMLLDVEVLCPPYSEQNFDVHIEYVDPMGGNNGSYDDNFDDFSPAITFEANGSRDYVFRVWGSQVGYGLRISIDGAVIDDIFDDKGDTYLDPIEISIYGNYWQYGPLVQNDADYYSFYMAQGWEARVLVHTAASINMNLGEVNLGDGSVPSMDTTTDDGELEILITASNLGEYVFRVQGESTGHWYELQIEIDNKGYISDENHGFYPDYLEGNRDPSWPTYLEDRGFEVPGRYNGLNTWQDEDYYAFHVEATAVDTTEIGLTMWYSLGADVKMWLLDTDGSTILASNGGETDPDGVASIMYTADTSGDYIIKIAGEHASWGDRYDFDILIDNVFGPEYWSPNNPDMKDDGDDRSMWVRETIDFVYHNPFTGLDGIIVSTEVYKFPTMAEEDLIQIDLFREKGTIDPLNPNENIGDGYFHKDLDFESTAFLTWFEDIIVEDDFNLTTGFELTSGEGWVQVTGTTMEDDLSFFFFAERLPNVGVVRYFRIFIHNDTNQEEFKIEHHELNFVIDCSIPNTMTESHSSLGVVEGDWWTYLVQSEKHDNQWGTGDNFGYNNEAVHYATFTVTHIFALNHTTMGVVGKMEVQTMNNDGSIAPEKHVESFEPFLVWDTANPVSFITMGGHGDLDGPPLLLPSGVNWADQETAMLSLFASMGDEPEAYHFDDDTVRFRFNNHFEETRNEDGGTLTVNYDHRNNMVVDVNEFGMTTHLDQYFEHRSNYHFEKPGESFDYGEEQRNSMVAFMIDASKGCVYEDEIDVITSIDTGDTFVWERSEYRPAGEFGSEDPGRDPADKEYEKTVIVDALSAGDEYVVFLGSQFWKGPEDTEFMGRSWNFDTPDGPISANLWYISSIRADDVWTWFDSQLFDKNISDLSLYAVEIAEMLTYAFELPPAEVITPNDISFNGTSFEVVLRVNKDGEDIDHIFRFAINNEGVLQDMFMGNKRVGDGVWLEWDRTVLFEATSPRSTAFTIGEYFLDDIPANYVPTGILAQPPINTTTDTTTDGTTGNNSDVTDIFGDIPSYPTAVVLIISIISVVGIVSKKRN